jgi:hypothetical protein
MYGSTSRSSETSDTNISFNGSLRISSIEILNNLVLSLLISSVRQESILEGISTFKVFSLIYSLHTNDMALNQTVSKSTN